MVQEHEELVAELAAARQQHQSEKQQVVVLMSPSPCATPDVPLSLCHP